MLDNACRKYHIVKALKDYKCTQLVTSITRPVSGTCLDHIWSNKPDRVLNISCTDIGISDHLPTIGVRLYKQSINGPKSHKYITYRNLKNLNEKEFLKTLDETPWDSAFVFEDVDDIVDSWYCLFNEAVNIHMPLKKKRIKYDMQPKWLTSELLELIKSQDYKLKKAKYSNLPEDWLDLKREKNKVTAAVRSAKKKFFYQSLEENRNNPKNSGPFFDIFQGETQILMALYCSRKTINIYEIHPKLQKYSIIISQRLLKICLIITSTTMILVSSPIW